MEINRVTKINIYKVNKATAESAKHKKIIS